jgi:uncharacterized protein (DUF1015 family)
MTELLRPGAVHPFTGRLVTADWAPRVVSPMLDAVSAEAMQVLAAAHADSWLHVTRLVEASEGARVLRRLLDSGAFQPADRGYFVYQIEDGIGAYTGVVANVEAAAFVDGRVRGHEAVQQERVEGVLRHFAAVPARSELVALLYPAVIPVDDVVAGARSRPPVLSFESSGELRQTVWRVDDQDGDTISKALGDGPLYVADGHHRVAASLAEWYSRGRPTGATVPCVLFPPGGLRLQAFHRRIRGPVDTESMLAGLRQRCDLHAADSAGLTVGHVGVYVDGRWYRATLPASTAAGVEALDVAQLQHRVLGPILGIDDAGDPRLEVLHADAATLEQACDADGGVAFVLAPPTVDQLVDVADRGQVMMPKSTFFEPKPQAGLFLQLADVR